jgi:MinD-like ATPase involved in chromosome partitioning or flagellar assembly
MDGIQFADGFDTPDRLAFGLGAPQLLTVVAGCLVAFALLHAPLPAVVTIPMAILFALGAALLGWARIAGRPALEWALFALRFVIGPREGTVHVAVPGARSTEAGSRAAAVCAPPALVTTPGGRASVTTTRARSTAADAARIGSHALASNVVQLPPRRIAEEPLIPGGAARTATRHGGARRVVFYSLKGGTGRTTLSTELATWLAVSGTGETALVDCDLRAASVGCRLGLTRPGIVDYALADPDERRLDDFLAADVGGLRVLPGPSQPTNPSWPVTPALLREVLRELDLVGTRTVVVDVSADLTDLTRAVLRAADDVVVVIVPTSSGIEDAYRTTEELRKLGLRERLSYVVNRARHAVDVTVAMNDLGGEVTAEIPEDPALIDAENMHRPAVLGPTGAATLEIRRLATQLLPVAHAAAR